VRNERIVYLSLTGITYKYFSDNIVVILMNEQELLTRININPQIFGGKPIIRGRRLAVEQILGMLAAGDTSETLIAAYPWLELNDIRACLVYARRLVGHECVEPLII
jgi:uncharacterized protein (DUF433 family)